MKGVKRTTSSQHSTKLGKKQNILCVNVQWFPQVTVMYVQR